MLAGPVFSREAVTTPRRPRHYLLRAVYVASLLVLMCTAWLVLAGTQIIRNVGDMARFGSILFQILAPFQMTLVIFLSALVAASGVSQEKDKRTLILLLMTRMSNSELVIGMLLASLLNVFVMLVAAVPVFMLITLFGGVSFTQVGRIFAVTFTTALASGSLGCLFALWREKTFQTLAITALTLVIWLGAWEAIGVAMAGQTLGGLPVETVVAGCSPMRAILVAVRPTVAASDWLQIPGDGVSLYLMVSVAITILLNGIAIARVRVWNPSREVRAGQQHAHQESATIWGADHELQADAEAARSGHVDARLGDRPAGHSRRVWDNPVLWREICTWAYGRKILIIRIAYLVFFAMAAAGLHWAIETAVGMSRGELASYIPLAARPLTPFFIVSIVIVNALAVTSITNERDGQALDLLLVTDLSPKEFFFGKLGGVFWVTKEMILLPVGLCIYLHWAGGIRLENLIYLLGGLLVMNVFVATLGTHCGMTYANSRTAIGVSLGAVFFLFLGVTTCMMMMISFSGSFEGQLAPFLAFILGGSVGLYVTLGARNPSPAILLASLLLPFATFFAITSFLLGNRELSVFFVTAATYGFTTAAMMVPALSEFDIAMGRKTSA